MLLKLQRRFQQSLAEFRSTKYGTAGIAVVDEEVRLAAGRVAVNWPQVP